jgi:hypothetical protein
MITNITMDRVWPGHPINLAAGKTASIALPAGWVARVSTDLAQWDAVAVPYTATVDCIIRIDCDVYHGTPVTASLEIA